jgi:hypothetical protein
MTEIAIDANIRILLPGKYDACPTNRFYISRKEAFLIMCSMCGGTVNIVYHGIHGNALPAQSPCDCKSQ